MDTLGQQFLHHYFSELSISIHEQLGRLEKIYSDWNEKINVISRKDIGNLMLHHVIHSLALLKFDPIKTGSHILDIGTGGGFPGIPLAICNPEVHFTLVDGRNKKILVASDVVKELQLTNVRVTHGRSEELKEKFNIVTGRAVTGFPEFRKMARLNLHKGGKIYYWTGGELGHLKRIPAATLLKLSDIFKEAYFEDKYIIKSL
ncbi:16S rRNA (guanine(527)-N(7))-methyltransferase RsmG [Bacteroidota bacterium]